MKTRTDFLFLPLLGLAAYVALFPTGTLAQADSPGMRARAANAQERLNRASPPPASANFSPQFQRALDEQHRRNAEAEARQAAMRADAAAKAETMRAGNAALINSMNGSSGASTRSGVHEARPPNYGRSSASALPPNESPNSSGNSFTPPSRGTEDTPPKAPAKTGDTDFESFRTRLSAMRQRLQNATIKQVFALQEEIREVQQAIAIVGTMTAVHASHAKGLAADLAKDIERQLALNREQIRLFDQMSENAEQSLAVFRRVLED